MAGQSEVLERLPLFAPLGEEDRGLLASHSVERRLHRGEQVYRAGDPCDGYYVVCSGTVLLIGKAPADGRELLGRLRPGDCFGECGLFEGHDRMETAEAEGPASVLRLERRVLVGLLERYPLVALKLRLAAAREFSSRVETGLAIAKRRAPRFFVNQGIRLAASPSEPRPATMIDVSELGVRIQGAPGSWGQNRQVDVEMAWSNASLRRKGRVAWYREGLAGLEFRAPSDGERDEVRKVLRRLLRREGGSAADA